MATGLSAAAIVAAYKISDGVSTGMTIMAEKHPEQFGEVVKTVLAPFRWGLFALWLILLLPLASWSYRFTKKIRRRPAVKPDDPERRDAR